MNIDLSSNVAIAQLTFVLLIIAIFLAFLVFGKIDREIKARKKSQ